MTAATHATEQAQSSANAMLTAKAQKVLTHVVSNRPIDSRETAILARTADLFGRILAGSLFVENRQLAGIAASHESLAEYERAVSAARRLSLVSLDRDLTTTLDDYRQALLNVSRGSVVAPQMLSEVGDFLSILSDFFFSDLVRPVSDSTTEIALG